MSSLVPYEPFRHLDNIRREFDRFWAHDFPFFSSEYAKGFGMPSIDLYETKNEIIARCDLPGLESKDDVQIDIADNILTISGSLRRSAESKEENLYRQERFYGSFHRSVTLPARISTEDVKATYKNGVLEIRMPRQHADNRRNIDIEFN